VLNASPLITTSFIENNRIDIVVDPYASNHERFNEIEISKFKSFDPPMARVSNSSIVDNILANHAIYTERNKKKEGK
jgi:hypothetical protein